jgi:hypothetical protein
LFDKLSSSFLAFDVFVFNRMRHNGLLLLLVGWVYTARTLTLT